MYRSLPNDLSLAGLTRTFSWTAKLTMNSLFTRFRDSSEKNRTGNNWNIYTYIVNSKLLVWHCLILSGMGGCSPLHSFAVCDSLSHAMSNHPTSLQFGLWSSFSNIPRGKQEKLINHYHPPSPIIVYHHLPLSTIYCLSEFPISAPPGGSERSYSELCDTRPFTFGAFRCIWAMD